MPKHYKMVVDIAAIGETRRKEKHCNSINCSTDVKHCKAQKRN